MQDALASPAPLTVQQAALIPVAAFAAIGDMPRLNAALEQGLDQGLTVSEAREILVQVYAYAGFPRSLNALGELMKVLQARVQRGIHDDPGTAPSKPIPTGEALLAAGTANQTRLAGAPVAGPLFEFAPAADTYLKTHLFGDIFERDNVDWQTREIATVAMLSVIDGTDAQLGAHMGMAQNAGVTPDQLHRLAQILETRVGHAPGQRTLDALAAALPPRAAH